MKGFTLIEIVITLAVVSISLVTIFMSINKLGDMSIYCDNINRIVHFSESKFNTLSFIEKKVFSYSGNVEDMSYRWIYTEDDIGVFNIKRRSIKIYSNSDNIIFEIYEYTK